MTSTTEWKMNVAAVPRPHVTVSALIFDRKRTDRFLAIWRSDAVRSAKNCWSLPSGLHEVGLSLAEQICVEAEEECGVVIQPKHVENFGVYENIARCDGYHWVINVAIAYGDFSRLAMKEPDKHPKHRLLRLEEVATLTPWAPHLGEYLIRMGSKIDLARRELLLAHDDI